MAVSDSKTDAPSPPGLTDFQQLMLTILADGPKYGLAVKEELAAYYGEEVNHGRLYPNLDQLVDHGLVEKSQRDKRTNEYAITDSGRRWLEQRRSWEEGYRGEE